MARGLGRVALAAVLEFLSAASPDTDAVGQKILDAAGAEFQEYGFKRTSLDAIAKRAGLSRATVYRRFENKDVLIQTVMLRQSQEFFRSVALAVHRLPTPQERLVEGFVTGYGIARVDPLWTRLLSSEPETVLPYATIGSSPLVQAAAAVLVLQEGDNIGELSDGRTTQGISEVFIRLAVSYLLCPQGAIPFGTEDEVRAFARSYLAPLMR
ncbi:TetR/AcrR family transcriptional regulator [Pseudonocardiaceae bacterium YIM PH 21723]|nr:TetR/AcrR family transcriptional regulator [Pseudonocardiaceae bacterium YIM PH 21723]